MIKTKYFAENFVSDLTIKYGEWLKTMQTVCDQVILSNKNIVEILGKINTTTTTQESSISIQIYDENGVLRNFSIPSFTSLKAEIDRLNNNINSLYSIDSAGAMVPTPMPIRHGIDADINKFTIISTTGYYNTVGVHCLIITYSVG